MADIYRSYHHTCSCTLDPVMKLLYLRLDPAIGRRVSVRAVAGPPRVTIEVLGSRSPTSPLPSALHELCYRSHPWWICRWSKGADVWRVGARKLGAWSVVVLFPGGGGYYSSIAAGSCLRGVKA
ncbi:hypothetical protein YC2023_093169 [Brassica napus]